MQKSRIEWTNYTINPVKGLCPVDCKDNQGKSYCYARRMYKRFKWNPEIRFDGNALTDFPDKPSRIFVGSTIELFDDWVKPQWMEQIMALPSNFPQHTFIFLTKKPWKAKRLHFPSNAWLGVSVDTMSRFGDIQTLNEVDVRHRLVSFEPLLDFTPPDLRGISWVIIGAQTPFSIKTAPKMAWIQDIVIVCDKAGIPVFQKNNLQPLLVGEWAGWKLRQEFPDV